MDNEKERDEHLLIFSAQLNGSVFIAFTSKAFIEERPRSSSRATQVTNNNKASKERKKEKKNTTQIAHCTWLDIMFQVAEIMRRDINRPGADFRQH